MAIGDYISGEPGQVTNTKSPPQRINDAIQKLFSPVSEVTGNIGGGIGKAIGSVLPDNVAPKVEAGFRSAGEAAPRMVANAFLTGATGRFAPLAKAIGYGDVGLESYANAPEDASVAQKLGGAAIQTAAWKAAPEVGGRVGGAITKSIAGKPTGTLLNTIVHRGGSALGTLGAFEAANAASEGVTGGDWNPFTIEHAAAATAMVGAGELAHLTAPMLADKLAKDKTEQNSLVTHLRDTTPIQSSAMWREGETQGPFGFVAHEALNEPERYGMSRDVQGNYTSEQLKNRFKTILPPAEWDVWQKAGIESLLNKPKVHEDDVRQWMRDNGPKVEVKTFTGENAMPQHTAQIVAEITHDLDTRYPGWVDDDNVSDDPEYLRLRSLLDRAKEQLDITADFDPNVYKGITPHHGNSVALLVRAKGPAKFIGRHFDEADKNVLASVRGYWTELNGKKVFHVFEVQSDWGQAQRRDEQSNQRAIERGLLTPEQRQSFGYAIPNNPLLKDYNRLALQTALDYAVKNGADAMAVSDAETAMMTEGHDRDTSIYAGEAPKFEEHNISQAKGMRLNYDRILPEVMEKQTGVKGEKTVLGEHQNAYPGAVPEQIQRGMAIPRSNLIFKEPTGEPKTSITANLYDLTKFKKTLAERGGMPLFGGGKFVINTEARKMFRSWEEDGVSPVVIHTTAEKLASLREKTNESMLDTFARLSGIDPKFNLPNNPQTLLESTKKYFDWRGEMKGLPPEVIQEQTRQALKVAAMLGRTLGETRVLPAIGTSFFEPSRWNIANALIGLLPLKGIESLFYELHQFAHEAIHNIGEQVDGKTFGSATPEMVENYKEAYATAYKMTREQMWDHLAVIAKGMVKDGEGLDVRKEAYLNEAIYKTQDQITREFLSDLGGLVTIGAASPKEGRAFKTAEDLFRFVPDRLGFIKGFVKDLAQILDGLGDYAKRFLGWNTKTLGTMDAIHNNLKGLLLASEKADASVELFLRHYEARNATPWAPIEHLDVNRIDQLNRFINNSPWDPELKDVVMQTSQMIVPQTKDDGLGKTVTFIDKLKGLIQLNRDFPEMLPAGRLGRSYLGDVSNAIQQMWSAAKDPLTGKADYEGFGRLKRQGPTGQAFSDVLRKQNEGDGSLIKQDDKDAVPSYAGLSKEDKAFIDTKLAQASAIKVQGDWMKTRMLRRRIGYSVGPVLMSHDTTLTAETARDLSHALCDVFLEPDLVTPGTGDPDAIQKRQAALQSLAIYPKQDLLQKAAEVVQTASESFLKAREKMLGKWIPPSVENPNGTFEMKPGYFPEYRIGRYTVEWTNAEGKGQYEAYKTKGEYTKRYQELQTQGAKDLSGKDRQDSQDSFNGLRPDAFAAFIAAEKKALDAAVERINANDPNAKAVIEELQKEYTLGEASALLTSSPLMEERRLTGGRELLNMADGLIHHIDSVAYTTAKAEAKGYRRLILNDPQLRANPNLQMEARKALSEILDPKGKEWTLVKQLVFFNYLGLRPSQALVEMTQQYSSHVPALINQGMGIGEAYKAASKALMDSANAVVKGVKTKAGINVYDDPLETRALKEAKASGAVDAGWAQELFHLNEDLPFANARNMFSGGSDALSREGLIGKPLYSVLKLARNFYSLSTTWNSEAAFLSSFRFFYDKVGKEGLTEEKRYAKAMELSKDLTSESMYTGGKANRPLFFLTGRLGSSVGGVMYMLQSYTYNAIAQQARYLKNSIVGGKLEPAERVAAGKAAGVALVTQMVMAGAMGLPFASAAMALVEQLFPLSEPKRRMRELFQMVGEKINKQMNLFQNDEDMGHFVSDAAMDGIMNQGPVDLSSRFQLGGLLGVDPYQGFSWGNVVGPSGDMLENWFVKAPQALFSGQPGEALKQVLPTSLKTIADLSMNGFELRNRDERLNVQLTDAEKGLMLAGFKPKRAAQFQNLNDMQQRAEKVMTLDQRQFHGAMADLMLKGEEATVRDKLLQRGQEVPDYDVRAGARRIAELVQERQIPFDPARDASRVGATYQASKLFPQAEQPVGETQRLLERQQLVQSLGFRAPLSKSEVRQAQLVDQLMNSWPGMSRSEAMAMIEQMTGQWVKKEFGF